MATSIREAARAVAGLDALTGLADVAATSNFCAPELTNNRELTLSAARHPVVEQLLVETSIYPQRCGPRWWHRFSRAYWTQRQWEELLSAPNRPHPIASSNRQLGARQTGDESGSLIASLPALAP